MAASSSPLVQRLISASVSIANRSGKLIRDILSKGDLGIVDKGINDLQTEADRSTQRCIVASLSHQFPNIKIIGEETLKDTDEPKWVDHGQTEAVLSAKCPESLTATKDEDVVVWVDPLDGTKEFTQGLLDHVTVLIGVAVHGKAVGGVIHQPYYNYQAGPDAELGRTIWGIVGLGSFGYDAQVLPKDQHIITTTRSHSQKSVVDSVDACEPTEVLRVGGSGHKVLLVLEGLAHAYVFGSPGCCKWDTCAGEAILRAVGGKLTDIHGIDIPYDAGARLKNHTGVIATCHTDHSWYVSKIPQSVRDELKA